MSDSEYSESLDINGQDESEGNDQQINAQMLQLQQHHHQMLQQQLLLQQQQQQHQQQHQGENVKFMEYAGSTSSSGDSSISSTSSDDSDDNETEDTLELAKITNEVLNLPRGLCENSAVFQEFFSLNTWHELPIPVQNHLQQFLPRFNQLLPPQLAAIEQTRTLSMLFNNELSRFGQTPLTTLQQQLEAGNCRPDIIKLRQSIMKSRRREQRFQHCEQLSQVAKQLFLSRQRLLDTAYKSAPDTVIKPSSFNTHQPKPAHLYMDNKLSAMRARKRFHNEISNIAQQLGFQEDLALSADEEDNDCLVAEELKKDNLLQQKSLVDFNEPTKPATSLADRCIYSTVFKKRQDIEDEEAFRLQQKSKQLQLTNRNFRDYLRDHKRRKLTEPTLPEFETSDIRLRDVCARAQMGGNFKKIFAMGKPPGRKPKIMPTLATTATTQPATTIPIITNATTTITNTNIKTAITQPITLTSLPPPPPPKLSEPPALVPIKQTIKKPETYQVVKTNANITTTLTPTKEQQHHHQHQQQISISSLPIELQHKLQQHHQNSNDNLHLNPLLNVTNHTDNLNLCMDDSSLLAGEHDGFNMLDNEVELQQEEVETFAGTCEETIPAFVIANDVVMPGKNKTNKLANISDTTKGLLTTRNQQLNSITQQPLPKLEPLSRIVDTKPSVKPLLTQKSTINTTTASELIQETHACYFSLIRDFFCSTPNHRMRYDDLRMKIDVWLRNPITALNEWYSLAENWSNLLRSAINFLVGEFPDLPEEYVPYIEHKTQINIYQWIGAGRDSDTRLNELCSLWMEKRKQPNDLHKSSVTQAELKLEISPRNSIESEDSPEGDSDKEGCLSPPPPPPRFPTNWMVRPATLEEISEFQRQERDRFDQPHKAYTYRMFGYESVVGPVKGIYTPLLALSKPRGHSMMVGDRPNFVTILTLVRDATARLPNGEGTRADISELLKCSQYINQDAAENVLQTIVSGALDRMHTEHDPCVRYDPNRKIWIYLHRNRSEGDFERIHQENQCNIGKTKKLTQRKPRPANATSKSINLIDQDHFNILTPSVSYSSSSSNNNGTLLSMPALVPSNPIIVTNQTQRQQQQQHVLQQQQQQQINMNKCPPVPPLKYNIPPSSQQSSNQQQQQQQQKSLLKTTLRTENKTSTSSTSSAANPATATNVSKQYSFQMPQAKNNPQHNTTPIIVATPQGLQTVHVSNATSVMASPATSPQQQQQQNSQQQQTNITAQLAGKRVTLNKPIVINQITQQSPSNSSSQSSSSSPSQPQQQQKIKSPQQVMQKSQLIQNHRINIQNQQQQQQQQIITQQQQHHHHQQQQPSNIIIPLSMANSMNITVNSSEQINTSSSTSHSSSPSPKQNIIRLVPASNVKSTMNSPASTQIVNRQRILSSQTAERPNTPQHQQQQKLNSGIQLLSNSGNIVTVSSGIVGTGASVTNPAGSIVKMSPQQFVSLQQKQAQQQQQQQHIIVKQTGVTKTQTAVGGSKPQRVILGNTSVMTQSGQGKNIVLQQIPVASSSVVVTPSHTTTITSSTSTISGNKIQTINTTNLTPQQQRILIQNLKQQQQQQQHQTINQNQIQFKTVQVVQNNTSTQQQHNIVGSRSQTITMATQQQQQHPKTLVVVSQDNGTQQHQQQQITRILKSSPQLKSDVTPGSTGTRVITSSSGQIISLDNLIQKQGGTLRITGSGGNTQTIKTNQQHITNIIQKSQLQQQQQQQHHQQKQLQTQQYAIVSVPNSIISLGNNSNFTVGQRIITTQAGISSASSLNTTSLVNIGSTRVTPTPVASSSGTGRVITATAAGTKIITKPTGTSTGNIRVINTVNQTGNISLATLQGKQVVLATGKTMNTISKNQLQAQQTQQQHSIVQTQGGSIVIGGQTVKLQQGNTNIQQLLQKSGNIITTQNPASSQQTAGTPQMQTVIMGNQILRVQQMPQIVSNTNRLSVANTKIISSSDNITATNSNTPKTIFVGTSGQTLRLQSSSASSSQTITNKNIIVQSQQQNISSVKTAPTANVGTTPNRVVLAVQGGGQIFLSPNFQGGNINLKSLQNMKVVSLAQHQASLSKDSSSSTSSSLTSQTTILKASSTPTASDTNV